MLLAYYLLLKVDSLLQNLFPGYSYIIEKIMLKPQVSGFRSSGGFQLYITSLILSFLYLQEKDLQ